MLIMVVAITLLMAVLAALTLLDPQKLFTSLIVVAAAMVILAAASALMQGCLVGALALLAASVALVIAAAGLIVFAIALRMLVGLPFEDIFIGLSLVGAGLIVLAVGLALMTAGIIGAVVLAIADDEYAHGLYYAYSSTDFQDRILIRCQRTRHLHWH